MNWLDLSVRYALKYAVRSWKSIWYSKHDQSNSQYDNLKVLDHYINHELLGGDY